MLAAPGAFSPFCRFLPLPLYAWLLVESAAARFADYAFLLYFLTETPQQALEAFPLRKSYFRHMTSLLPLTN
jgi:hypothetical protein